VEGEEAQPFRKHRGNPRYRISQKAALVNPSGRSGRTSFREFLGLKRNLVLLLVAIIVIGAGEETWMRFVPKYLESLAAAALVIGLYDGLKTLLGAVYAYPGGVVTDRWGHRKGLMAFTCLSIAGYVLVLLVPRWPAVVGGTFLFLAWSTLSLPAMFSLVATSLSSAKHTMGIGIQSLIKRVPILIGPVLGGLLVDKLGVASGVRAGAAVSIAAGIFGLAIQSRVGDAGHSTSVGPGLFATIRGFEPRLRRLLRAAGQMYAHLLGFVACQSVERECAE